MKKAVHFGAGNIGRGFIGLLLYRSGYSVTFVDVSDRLVGALQERGEYTVALADQDPAHEQVKGVTAIHGGRKEEVAAAIADAEVVTTAVGVMVLPHIAESLAMGIRARLQQGGRSLAVIACENTIGGSSQLKNHVYKHLTAEEQSQADALIRFPDAAVDRIVPLQKHEDPLFVTVEPFYEWVVARSSETDGIPEIDGVHYVESLEPYIARKLFTVNTGHCCAAYFGYGSGYATIGEAMADEEIRGKVLAVLGETGGMLSKKYGFDEQEHLKYIHKIMERFENPFLSDDVQRVGRSPLRKLSPNDRLVRPALLACEQELPADRLAEAMGAAMHFRDAGDPEAVELEQLLKEQGTEAFVESHMGISPAHPLYAKVIRAYESFRVQAGTAAGEEAAR